ncbi:MAG: peptide chain release factor N(5)-glutamine methyltransferase [Tannerella sp.]|jgi:release factor glutamine methyltransferase|nr:peptide chain release factor N(5)-glutamine methyltransferase [Tannerella sp.]
MQETKKYIFNSLKDIYPEDEIRSFIRVILSSICGMPYSRQVLNREALLPAVAKEAIHRTVERLKTMEPLQYVLGETEFYSLPFKVDATVLIPRPETEELVDMIIKSSQASRKHVSILDIGTGSGCIAVTLAKHILNAGVTAIDVSEAALATARKNAVLNNVDIDFANADILQTGAMLAAFSSGFDIIVSNPPYVCESEKAAMTANVLDYEPHGALFVPDAKPLLYYRSIADFALQRLSPDGRLFLEINPLHSAGTVDLLAGKGFTDIKVHLDLSGKNRFITAKLCKELLSAMDCIVREKQDRL